MEHSYAAQENTQMGFPPALASSVSWEKLPEKPVPE